MFLAKRNNGYYFIEYRDPSTNQLKRLSAKTKSKTVALKFFTNFDKDYNEEKSAIKISNLRDEYLKSVIQIFYASIKILVK